MKAKKVLTIDGDYFGHRAIHGLRITEPNLTLGTQGDIMKFESELNNQLVGLLEIFTGIVDNFVFTFDSHSWRKNVEPYHPYYIPQNYDKPLGYKANREELKSRDDIDYEMFRVCMDNFYEKVSKKIPTFKIDGLEGDDLMLLISKKFGVGTDEVILFCNDGDLTQIINNNTHMFRNVKSKVSPDGEIWISKKNYDSEFKESSNFSFEDMFTKSSFDNETIKTLFKTKLDSKNKFNCIRKPGVNIRYSEPLKIAFIKSITGDKKDNIFPILRWEATTGTRNYSVTEKHILKCFESLGYTDINDATIKSVMDNDDDFRTFFINLVSETKQMGIAKNILKHFWHNWKINTLSIKNIPENLVENFNISYATQEERIYTKPDELMQLSVSGMISDSASNILLNSVPGSGADILNSWNIEQNKWQTNGNPNTSPNPIN